ncbi:hypothetical protein GGI35DRAFT_474167 [Trichoderma velutinum]
MSPFVRTYDPNKDKIAVPTICRDTVHEALAQEPMISIAPFIWATPYIHLHPDYCFVLDSGNETVVGYIIGTPDNEQFLAKYHSEYLPTLDSVELPKPSMDRPAKWVGDELPIAMLQLLHSPGEARHYKDFPQLVEQYPAHLHINLLPDYQQKGYGKLLMDRFLAKLHAERIKGVHLVLAADNINADKFYQKTGFKNYLPAENDNEQDGEASLDGEQTPWVIRVKDTDLAV